MLFIDLHFTKMYVSFYVFDRFVSTLTAKSFFSKVIFVNECSQGPRKGIFNLYKEIKMTEQKEVKTVNIAKTVEYLNRSFQEACRGLSIGYAPRSFNTQKQELIRWEELTDREQESEKHYHWQVEFAYAIDELQRGPAYIAQKTITDCNKIIEEVREYKASKNEKVKDK